jgi:hypothetical protein
MPFGRISKNAHFPERALRFVRFGTSLADSQRKQLNKRKLRPFQKSVRAMLAMVFLLPVIPYFAFDVRGQEGTTQINGLDVAGYFESSRKPEKASCEIQFTFSGSRTTENRDCAISNVMVIRAVDDTGRSLLWTNPARAEILGAGTIKIGDVFERQLGASVVLKSPSADAGSVQLEGDADLLTPTIPRVVFTNVAAYSGEILKNPLLDNVKVQIKVLRCQNEMSPTIALEYKDPNHQLLEVGFQHHDGTPIDDFDISSGEMRIGKNESRSYTFKKESLQDVCLAVRLDVPLRREATHFRISWPRLPWVQPTNLEVISIEAFGEKLGEKKSGSGYYLALATFQGGLLTNALGIRKVSITKAENQSSEDVTTVANHLSPYELNLREKLEDGGFVTKGIWLQSRSSPLKMIKTLEGDAELYEGPGHPVLVDLRSDLKPGETMTSPELKQYGASFTFVGARNFNKTEDELNNSDDFVMYGWFRKEKETPEDLKDALLFSCVDPKNAMASHAGLLWEFLDAQEWRTSPDTIDYTPKSWLFRFDELPKKARVVVYVIDPAAIRIVHFKAENIPVR